MGARADRRSRAARTRLGFAARQSLRFADLAASLSRRSGGAARFRRGVGRRRRAGLDPAKRLDGLSYKWPNDVLLRGRKIAGILLEFELGEGEAPEFVVVGVGINLVSSPRDAEFPATSIAEEDLGTVSPGAALEELCPSFPSLGRALARRGLRAHTRGLACARGGSRRADPGAPGARHLARPVPRHRSARRAAAGERGGNPAYRRR